jgi:hypothetical protein
MDVMTSAIRKSVLITRTPQVRQSRETVSGRSGTGAVALGGRGESYDYPKALGPGPWAIGHCGVAWLSPAGAGAEVKLST